MAEEGIMKNFKGMLILDCQTGDVRFLKNLKRKRKPSVWEVMVEVNIDVTMPGKTMHKIDGKIELKQGQLRKMTLDAM